MSRSSQVAATVALVLSLLLIGVAAGCGDSGSSKAAPAERTSTRASSTDAEAAPKPKPKPAGKKVTLHSSDYGTILADGRGRALYLFTHDTKKSRCYGRCATAWPPFLTKGQPRAVGKVQQSLLGTVKRDDGKKQVTYNGHPVYYYVSDKQPGQVLCQAVLEYGGYWYVVDRSGKAIR
jgi:predicted lipoprotein with Yx(FWY)xxD motif